MVTERCLVQPLGWFRPSDKRVGAFVLAAASGSDPWWRVGKKQGMEKKAAETAPLNPETAPLNPEPQGSCGPQSGLSELL